MMNADHWRKRRGRRARMRSTGLVFVLTLLLGIYMIYFWAAILFANFG